MVKKIGILIFVLILAGAGFFYWQNNQKDVRELNKNLPAGVKVAKNIFGFGNEYKVKNKIDGYEFNVPKVWKGVKQIEYIPERTEEGYKVATVDLTGLKGEKRGISVDLYKLININIDLTSWVQELFTTFGLKGKLLEEKLGEFTIIKTIEEKHLGGAYIYFIKIDKKIYVVTGSSEEFIREIISNGKW